MDQVLEIKPVIGSSVEDILAFKCHAARAYDQNLEILITNKKSEPVIVPSYFDLIEDSGPYRVETLIPHGRQEIPPGETIAFYCSMDEYRWNRAGRIVFYDIDGNEFPVDLVPLKPEV